MILTPLPHLVPTCSQKEPWTSAGICLSLLRALQWLHLTRGKRQSPRMAQGGPMPSVPTTALTSPPTFPLSHSVGATWASCCSSNVPETPFPQDFCSDCSLSLECSSCTAPRGSLFQVFADTPPSHGGLPLLPGPRNVPSTILPPSLDIYRHLAHSGCCLFLWFLVYPFPLTGQLLDDSDFVCFVCGLLLCPPCQSSARHTARGDC